MTKTPDEIRAGMAIWFKDRGAASSPRMRSDYQKGWDAAVLAVAEYVRRRQFYDETLALEIHKLLTPSNP